MLSLRILALFLFLLFLFASYQYFVRDRFIIILKKDEIWLMRGRKPIKAGIILPLETFIKQLESFLEIHGLEVSLELVMSKGEKRKYVYIYHPSPEFLHSLNHTQVKLNSNFNEAFLSILGSRTFKRATSIKEKKILCLESAVSPFFVSLMTFSSFSRKQMDDLVENLRVISEKFDIDVHLIVPLKLERNTRYKLRKTQRDVTLNAFKFLSSPYVIFISRNLPSMRNVVKEAETFLYPLHNVSFMNANSILRNLLKIACRLHISSSFFPLNGIDALYMLSKGIKASEPSLHVSRSIVLGKLFIKDRAVDLKIDEKILKPILLSVKHISSLILILRKLASQLSCKWLVLDFQGATLQLRDAIGGGLVLSEKSTFTPISLVPSPIIPMHDYLARLVGLLAKVLRFPATKVSVTRELLRATNYEHITSFLLEVLRMMSDRPYQEERTKELLSDIESGALTGFFERNNPTLEELFPASRVLLDLSKPASRLKPTTIEFLTSVIIDLCPKQEYSLLIVAPPPIVVNLLDCGITDVASETFTFIFSTFNELPHQYYQQFKSVIVETESNKRGSKAFSFLRRDCPPITFYINSQDDAAASFNHNYSVIDLDEKILRLLESFPYTTEELISKTLGTSKEVIREALRKLRKSTPYVKRIYLPAPGGRRIPIFFLETENRKMGEIISLYAHDLIEKICNETGSLLVQARDPKLGLDGFIECYPFKLALTKEEREISKLSQQVEKIAEKHGAMLVILLDERDTKLAAELKQRLGDKVIVTYLGELDVLPLKIKAKQLSSETRTFIRGV
ncbi:MAG: hypothetical protein KIH01_02860 [Candidatus Freyarchaeota archaeon]|nr:hypothetical protein [Candidatus Jordarchaeia archaeon]